MRKYGHVGVGSRACNVRIDTVDSFQGKERDVIILSTVRAQNQQNQQRHQRQQGGSHGGSHGGGGGGSGDGGGGSNVIGFVSDVRRMNVAITRARQVLWIVGDLEVLKQNEAWRALIEDATERKRVRFDAKKLVQSNFSFETEPGQLDP